MIVTLTLKDDLLLRKCKTVLNRIADADPQLGLDSVRKLTNTGYIVTEESVAVTRQEEEFYLYPDKLIIRSNHQSLSHRNLLFSMLPIYQPGATSLNDLVCIKIAHRDGSTKVAHGDVALTEVAFDSFPVDLDKQKENILQQLLQKVPTHWEFSRHPNGRDVAVRNPALKGWNKTTIPYYFLDIGIVGLVCELKQYFHNGVKPMWWSMTS